MTNLYTPGGPVMDARMFFGRAYELSEIWAFLKGNQSVSIVGPAGIGKTSLMHQLMRTEVKTGLGIEGENLFVYINCQSLPSCRQDEIFAYFCASMAAALHAQSLGPEPGLTDATSKPTWPAFELAVRKLNQRGLRVLFMLDEFEQLAQNPYIDVRFYNGLRSAAGRLRLAFLTASTRPLIELTGYEHAKNILSSPFFNIFAQLFIGLFSEPEARSLIRRPLEAAGKSVSAQLEDFIFQLVGGHPLALQIACTHVWDSPEDLHRIERETLQELAPCFQSAWQDLTPVEREVLYAPAEFGARAAGNPALTIALRDLTRKCLLVRVGETYIYPSRAWTEFVSAYWTIQIKP